MAFLSPLILSALALASVPLIIHLLNRRRFQVVDWAPMRYLKLTLRTNRRRMRIEQWLLLLLRTLIIILLVLAVARPVLSHTEVGRWLTARGRTSHVLVIDDSLSMGYRASGASALAQAGEFAAEWVAELGTQDTLTVLLTSRDEPLLHEARPHDQKDLAEQLRRLGQTHSASHWAGTFASIDRHLQSTTFAARQLTIVTDLRRAGWSTEVSDLAQRWAGEHVALRVIDVGSRRTDNVALIELEQEDPPLALPGSVVRLRALIRNDGEIALPRAQATLNINDESRPVMLPELPPGVTQVPLSFTPRQAGQQRVHLVLSDDPLDEDNHRWLCIDVRPQFRILVIDGEPGALPFEGETDFLALAFTAGSDLWHIQRMTDTAGLAGAVERADLIVLANVASLSEGDAGVLARTVQAGAGLLLFPGDQLDLEQYNQRLYRGGEGLLPGRLEQVLEEPAVGLVVEPLEGSPLEPLRQLAPAALARVRARRVLSVQVSPQKDPATRVLARWNDAEGRPAILEKTFGTRGGRVLLWTLTADKAWSDWPLDPTYVLATRSAAINSPAAASRRLAAPVGQGVRHEFPRSAGKPLEPRLVAPGLEAAQVLLVEDQENGGASLRYTRTATAGLYRFAWKDAQGAAHSHAIAVNADPAESDLAPISEDELRGYLGPDMTLLRAEGLRAAAAEPAREAWRPFVQAVLALLLFEACLATWVGRER